jgi:hypothetical protein
VKKKLKFNFTLIGLIQMKLHFDVDTCVELSENRFSGSGPEVSRPLHVIK